MKSTVKLFGIIALVVVIVFTMATCDNGNGDNTTTYTVTFNSNGGSNVSSITGITSGSTITLPSDPSKTDNTFSGWYTDNETFQNQFTSSTVISSNLTVFAKWTYIGSKSITIMGLESYNGKYVHINIRDNDTTIATSNWNNLDIISSGKWSTNLWEYSAGLDEVVTRWSGYGGYIIQISVYENPDRSGNLYMRLRSDELIIIHQMETTTINLSDYSWTDLTP